MQVDRIITVVLKVKDPEASKEVWNNHINSELLAGCQVLGIANDNLISKVEELENDLVEMQDQRDMED